MKTPRDVRQATPHFTRGPTQNLKALAAERQQSVRADRLGQMLATGAVLPKGCEPGVERERARGLGRLLWIAVDGRGA